MTEQEKKRFAVNVGAGDLSRASSAGASLLASPLRASVAVAGAGLAALATGIPTGIVRTSLYTRMTPVRWWDYPFWVGGSVLIGLIAASFVTSLAPGRQSGRAALGGALNVFAIGCPICNKLVVALIGVSGALTYFAPLQPLLGAVSVALLAYTLRVRLRERAACVVR